LGGGGGDLNCFCSVKATGWFFASHARDVGLGTGKGRLRPLGPWLLTPVRLSSAPLSARPGVSKPLSASASREKAFPGRFAFDSAALVMVSLVLL